MRRALPLVLVGLLAALGFAAFAVSGGEHPPGSALGAERRGRLAAYLLLDELGLAPRAWRGAPGELPSGDALLWLPAAPDPPPEVLREVWRGIDDAAERGEGAPAARRLRDPRHYLRFVEEGGVLLAALDAERREFLVEELGLHELDEVEAERERGAGTQEVRTRAGETLRVAWSGRRRLAGAPASAERLLADAEGRPVALRLPVGRGAVVLVPDDGFATNGRIDEASNALLVVRLVEAAGGGPVLLDEYALGGWEPETPLGLALSGGAALLTLHLLAALALGLVRAAWSGPFPRDPEPVAAATPLERARGHAALLASAGRYDLLAELLAAGVRRRLAGRRHRSGELEDPERELALALEPLGDRLPEDELARLRADLARPAADDREALEALAARLARAERVAGTHPRPHNARPRAARTT